MIRKPGGPRARYQGDYSPKRPYSLAQTHDAPQEASQVEIGLVWILEHGEVPDAHERLLDGSRDPPREHVRDLDEVVHVFLPGKHEGGNRDVRETIDVRHRLLRIARGIEPLGSRPPFAQLQQALVHLRTPGPDPTEDAGLRPRLVERRPRSALLCHFGCAAHGLSLIHISEPTR